MTNRKEERKEMKLPLSLILCPENVLTYSKDVIRSYYDWERKGLKLLLDEEI